MALVRAGVPVLVLPMPLTGTTSPITVLGTMRRQHGRAALRRRALPARAARLRPHLRGRRRRSPTCAPGSTCAARRSVALINVIGIEMSRFYGLPVHGQRRHLRRQGEQPAGRRRGHAHRCGLRPGRGRQHARLRPDRTAPQTVSLAKVDARLRHGRGPDQPPGARRPDRRHARAGRRHREVGIGGHFLGRRSTRRSPRRRAVAAARCGSAGRSSRTTGGPRRGGRRAGATSCCAHARGAAAARRRGGGDRRGDRAVTRAASARRPRACAGAGGRMSSVAGPGGAVTIGPLDDLAALRRLGVACGLEDEGRDDEGILAAWGAVDGGPAGRRHRPRAPGGPGHGQLDVGGRGVPAPRDRRGALRAARARSARARHAAALGHGARAGVLPRTGLRAVTDGPSATPCSATARLRAVRPRAARRRRW